MSQKDAQSSMSFTFRVVFFCRDRRSAFVFIKQSVYCFSTKSSSMYRIMYRMMKKRHVKKSYLYSIFLIFYNMVDF